MNNRYIQLASLMILILGLSPVLAATLEPAFSADYRASGPGPGLNRTIELTGRVWVSHGKIRQETMDEGHVMILLMEPASQSVIQVVPDQGFYQDASDEVELRSLPGGPDDFRVYAPDNPCERLSTSTCTKLGTETINGRACENWQVVADNQATQTACIDQRLGFIVKKVQDNRTFELTNIFEGKQPPSLFKVPAGLKRIVLNDCQIRPNSPKCKH
jgi:hypothetical protein